MKETGTTQNLWTGILLECMGNTVKGVYDCYIQSAKIYHPGIAIKTNSDATCVSGFQTTNYFDNIVIWGPKVAGIDFSMDIAYTTTPDINGSHRFRFKNIVMQASSQSGTAIGVRNVRGRDHLFEGVYAADFGASSKQCTIHADSDSAIIIGGAMTITGRFDDNSTLQNTKIMDQYRHTQFGRVTPGISGTNIDIVPTGTTNTTSWWNSTSTERFYIQKNATEYQFDFMRYASGGALRPVLFRQYDYTTSTITEAFRIEADASVKISKYLDIAKMTAPAAPAVNNLRIFMDSVDEHIKHINSLGTAIDITGMSGPIEGKKMGRYDGTSSAGATGIFAGAVNNTGALNTSIDTTHGTFYRFNTGAVAGNGANFKCISVYTIRAFNPYLGVKFMVDVVTNNRITVGFKSNPSIVIPDGTDEPMPSVSGIMLVQRAGDTTFFIATNNGAATSTFTNTGVTVLANTLHTFRVRAVGDTKFQWSVDGGAWTDITTTIPASTTTLGFYAGIQTNEAIIHQIKIFGAETWSDK